LGERELSKRCKTAQNGQKRSTFINFYPVLGRSEDYAQRGFSQRIGRREGSIRLRIPTLTGRKGGTIRLRIPKKQGEGRHSAQRFLTKQGEKEALCAEVSLTHREVYQGGTCLSYTGWYTQGGTGVSHTQVYPGWYRCLSYTLRYTQVVHVPLIHPEVYPRWCISQVYHPVYPRWCISQVYHPTVHPWVHHPTYRSTGYTYTSVLRPGGEEPGLCSEINNEKERLSGPQDPKSVEQRGRLLRVVTPLSLVIK